jgi:putative effector of murein hydrolase
MRFPKSRVVKARILIGLVGLALPSIYLAAEYFGFRDDGLRSVIPIAIFMAIALPVFKLVDRILDKG